MKKILTLLLTLLVVNSAFAQDNYLIATVGDEEVIYKIDDPAEFESSNHNTSTSIYITPPTTLTFTSNNNETILDRSAVTYIKLEIPLTRAIANSEDDDNTEFCCYLFYNCTNLTTADITFTEDEDNRLTTVGDYFCAFMFNSCSALTTLSENFTLPQSITSVGDYFCDGMFSGCSALTTLPNNFTLPQGMTSAGKSLCRQMFYQCTALTTLPNNFTFPQSITTVGLYFCYMMFSECSELTELPDNFNLPQEITYVGDYSCYQMFSGCSALTTLPNNFTLPQSITSVGSYFCQMMFYGCTALTSLPDNFNLPEGITTVKNAFCYDMFYSCTLLTFLPDDFNLPQGITSINDYFCYCMFKGCSSLRALPDNFKIPQGITTESPTYFCYQMFNNCTVLDAGEMVTLTFPFEASDAFKETAFATTTSTTSATANEEYKLKGNSEVYYSIKYYDQDGNFLKTQHIEIPEGETTIGSFEIDGTTIIPDNYAFLGWIDSDGNEITIDTEIIESISLYAKVISLAFTANGFKYYISDLEEKTAEITGFDENAQEYILSNEVVYEEYDKTTFTVTTIQTGAFTGASNLTINATFSDPTAITIADDAFPEEFKGTLIVQEGLEWAYYKSTWSNYFTISGLDTFTKDGLTYTITDQVAKTVDITGYDSTSFTISTSVEYEEIAFTVENIVDDAFSGASNLQVAVGFDNPSAISLGTIAEGIIGTLTVPEDSEWAFYNSEWVKYFTIEGTESFTYNDFTYTINEYGGKEVTITGYTGGSTVTISNIVNYEGIEFTVTSISSNTFSGHTDLSVTVEFADPTAITIADDAFPEEFKGTLIVPSGSESGYHDSVWFNYFIIYGYNGVGDTFTVDGITYQKTATKEAKIIGVTKDEIEIVTTVTYNTEEFTVTNIANGAFTGYTDLSVTVEFDDPSTIELEEYEGNRFGTLTVPSGYGYNFYLSDWANYFDIETVSFTVDNIFYRVDIDAENSEVSIMHDESYIALNQTVTIPESVEYNNTAFVVTNIESGAFSDCTDLSAQVNFIDPETIELDQIATTKVGYLTVPDGAVGLYEESDWNDYFYFYEENRYLEIDSVYFVFKATSTQTASLKASHSAISLEVDHVDENATNVTIPSSISINLGDDIEVTYDVTSMSSNAFKDCENLTTVTIEANIPAEDADALTYVPESCIIVVEDEEVKSAYAEVLTYVNIMTYEEYEEYVEVRDAIVEVIIPTDKVEVGRYNLIGQKLTNPQRGINIIVYSDGTTKKILVK